MDKKFWTVNGQVSTDRLESVHAIATRCPKMTLETVESALAWGRVRGLIAFDKWTGSGYYYRKTRD